MVVDEEQYNHDVMKTGIQAYNCTHASLCTLANI